MKSLFTPLLIFAMFQCTAQTICGTAPEGGTVTLTAPANATITSIDFASYGTPNGTCGSFTIGGCHATNSQAICAGIFVGQNSASISASNGVFGDPCGGTVKRLYIQATYSFPLPLTLLSFAIAQNPAGKPKLTWRTTAEVNTRQFIIEKSGDGNQFSKLDSVTAAGSGNHSYEFIDLAAASPMTIYYRLKMQDQDGKFRYSEVVRFNSRDKVSSVMISPLATSGTLRITSGSQQSALILNSNGQVVRTVQLVKGEQVVSFGEYPAGIYFVKTSNITVRFLKI